jgi:tRNA 2-selenouridine synthase
MLDYYDRCYDHDLSAHATEPVELGDLGAEAAAALLLERGLVKPAVPLSPPAAAGAGGR